eukprot:15482610-Alexandrium_andersonii.AAC.1
MARNSGCVRVALVASSADGHGPSAGAGAASPAARVLSLFTLMPGLQDTKQGFVSRYLGGQFGVRGVKGI